MTDHKIGQLDSHSGNPGRLGYNEKIRVSNLDFWFGNSRILNDVTLTIYANQITALLGPSGCGKTTLLRCFNRTNEFLEGARIEGRILLNGRDIYGQDIDPALLRQRFGWVAQAPDPFPWSIRDNILYGPKLRGLFGSRLEADAIVEEALREVGLWDEVKNELNQNAVDLSVGQQQRMCLARAIASKPEVLLLDEPCSALDPVATALVENLLVKFKRNYTIIIVTHNIQQAARLSDRVAFFYLGKLVEVSNAEAFFLHPDSAVANAFIGGAVG